MIKRDIDNLTAYFSRFAPELAHVDYAAEIWSLYQCGKLHSSVNLTGYIRQVEKPINMGNILRIINTVLKKEAAWQWHKQKVRWMNRLSQC